MELQQRRKEIEQKLNQEWAKIEAEKQSLEGKDKFIAAERRLRSTEQWTT